MSFLEGLKKVIQGQPVYDSAGPAPTVDQTVNDPARQRPVKVYIEETDSRLNGDRLETYCRVRNDSDIIVLLDKIRILGGTTELDETLKPGDSKQVKVYAGSAPDNDNQHDAELQYRTEAGIYYKARHDVRFKPDGDYYTIEKIPYENTSQL